MPTAQASSPPFGATTTLGGGGGGGGGLTAESDPTLWYDITNDTYFYRHVVKDDTGAITSVSITTTAGASYTPGASVEPVGARYGLTGESDQIVLYDAGAANTPFLRRYVKDSSGAVTSTVDTQLNGTSSYTVVGPAVPTAPSAAFTGLTAEADQTVLYDTSAKAYFLRRYVKDSSGAVTSKVDTQLNGTSSFTVSAEGNVTHAPIQAARGPNVAVTYTRVTTATTTNIAAGALAVQYYVAAATVTVNGAAVPAGVGITHDIAGATTAALTVVTSGGTPDVLIIEERPV